MPIMRIRSWKYQPLFWLGAIFLSLGLVTLLLPYQKPASPETPTASPQATHPPTPTAQGSTPCAYRWASQPLTALSQQTTALLQAAGLEAEVRAVAYGEDCQRADGSSAGFAAMQTDFYLTLHVASLEDKAQLAQQLETALDALLQLPPETLTNPNPGYLGITFIDQEAQRLNIWQPLMHVISLRANGTKGEALLEALIAP